MTDKIYNVSYGAKALSAD